MHKCITLAVATALFASQTLGFQGNILSQTTTQNLVSNKDFILDLEFVYDIKWTLDLPSMMADFGLQSGASSQDVTTYSGAEVLGYLNFTVAAEFFEQTQQRFTISLVPFRVYPFIDHFKATRTVSNS